MKEYHISGNLVACSKFKISEDPKFLEYIQNPRLESFLANIDSNIIVVIGWDGSMLEAIGHYYPEHSKFFGINYGNKWFLLHPQSVLDISTPTLRAKNYPLISYNDWKNTHYAFNELDIKAADGKMLDMNLKVDDEYMLDILGDGLLISTPAGSTGYSSSLGGPILSHDINSYILTPKAAWKPRNLAPFILSSNQKIFISSSWRENQCEIYTDGRLSSQYSRHIALDIEILPSQIELYIQESYLKHWNNKILEEQGFSKK